MLEAGAQGYLLKNAYKHEIIQAIKTVYKGGNYYCTDTTKKLSRLISYSNYIHPRKAYKPLFTEKELAIIRLICKEYSSMEIAVQLQHSIRTIDSYRTNILKKMNVKTVTGLVMYAIRHRLYFPDETT